MKCRLHEFLEVYERMRADKHLDPNTLPLHMRRVYWTLRTDRRSEVINEFVNPPRASEVMRVTD